MKFLTTKNPLSSTIFFGGLGLLRSAVSLIFLPLFLNYLNPEDFGVISLVTLYATLLSIIGSLGLNNALYTFYYDFDDKARLKQYLGHIFSTQFFVFLGLIFLHLPFGELIFENIFQSEEVSFYPYGIIALCTAFFGGFNTMYFVFLKNEINLKAFFYYTIILVVFTASLQFLFIVIYETGILGFLLGILIPNIFVFLIIVFQNRFLISFKFDKTILKPSLNYSFKLMPFLLLFTLESQIEKYFLDIYLGVRSVGLYALLIKITGLLFMALSAFDEGIRPFVYRDLKAQKNTASQYFNLYLGFGVLVLSVVYFIGVNLDYIFTNPEYLEIKSYFFMACMVVFLLIPRGFFAILLGYYKVSAPLSWSTLIKILITIALMMILIPKYEMMGALYALLISNLFSLLFFGIILKKEISIKINLKTTTYIILFLIGTSLIDYKIIPFNQNIQSFIYLLVLSILFFRNYTKDFITLLKYNDTN